MKIVTLGAAGFVALALCAPALAQQAAATATTPAETSEVTCAEILSTPSASAEEIAAVNDTSVIAVLRCQADKEGEADTNIADLRSATAANTTLTPRLTAAGAATDQVIAIRRGPNGEFNFYVIGAFR